MWAMGGRWFRPFGPAGDTAKKGSPININYSLWRGVMEYGLWRGVME
jgi:hypothetical protein